MTPGRPEGVAAIREFFGARAAGWEDRFPDDQPAYDRAVDELAPREGGVALDAGCGTGRALERLRGWVGPAGLVVGLDATPEMLAEVTRRRRHDRAALVLGDAWRLPLADGVVDAVMAAGLLPHLADPAVGLAELARVCRPGARLAVFHPISRAALARRHGGVPSDDDAIAPARLIPAFEHSGWAPVSVDDSDDRFLAFASRR